MEFVGDFYLWIFVVLLSFVAYWYLTIPSNLPPGPFGLPVVGSLPFLCKKVYLSFIEIGKTYGNVVHLYMGSTLIVVLNDYEAIKEAFVNQAQSFSGRFRDPSFTDMNKEYHGIILADGGYWREHRRFIMSNLKNNGVGKLTLEPLLLNEIEYFLAEIRRHSGRPQDLKNLLPCSLANNVNLLITGQRFDYNHQLMKDSMDCIFETVVSNESINLSLLFPWTKHIPGMDFLTQVGRKRKNMSAFLSAVSQMISKVKITGNSDDSYIQAFMTERNQRLKHAPEEEIFCEKGLLHISRDLFIAGAETSSTTIMWLLLYMTHYPHVQNRVQEEIDRVIGRHREPSFADRFMTPYTEATILEVLRVTSLIPLSLPHRTTRDVTLFGYRVPRDTMVVPNIYAVHYDSKIWGDPENFRPDRFLGDDEKLTKTEYVLAFSIGKRTCVGEPLARMELYLYFVSLLQHFTFVRAEGVNQTLEEMPVIVRKPYCFTVQTKLRN